MARSQRHTDDSAARAVAGAREAARTRVWFVVVVLIACTDAPAPHREPISVGVATQAVTVATGFTDSLVASGLPNPSGIL